MRKSVIKITVKANIDVDPADLDTVLEAAKKQEAVKESLKTLGVTVEDFKGVLGTVEVDGDEPNAPEGTEPTDSEQEESE